MPEIGDIIKVGKEEWKVTNVIQAGAQKEVYYQIVKYGSIWKWLKHKISILRYKKYNLTNPF